MLRIKFIFLLFLLVLCLPKSKAQTDDEILDYIEAKGMNNWYIELGGSALLWSFNYEKYLYRNYSRTIVWTGRVGIGYSPFNYRLLNSIYLNENSVAMPFNTSLIYGKRKEKLELGGGFTLATKNFVEREVFPSLLAGFRVVDNNGTLLRILYTPHFRNEKLINWFGVSLGRNF